MNVKQGQNDRAGVRFLSIRGGDLVQFYPFTRSMLQDISFLVNNVMTSE